MQLSIYWGVEHAILHLLYSRFFTKLQDIKIKILNLKSLLKDYLLKVVFQTYKDENNNWLSPDEIELVEGKYQKNSPKTKCGLIRVDIKSKNVIDPENIINNYGADAVRLFILSDSPPEKDVQWSEQGMIASYKFLQKLWVLNNKIKEIIIVNNKITSNQNLEKFTNQLILKMTNNLENFNYNVIIANMYETYNFLNKEIQNEIDSSNLKENYIKILKLFSPVIPHFISECFESLNFDENTDWPKAEIKNLEEGK